MKMMQLRLLGSLCVLVAAALLAAEHQLGRHRRSIQSDHLYFIVRTALAECRVPSKCALRTEKALLHRMQVPRCETAEYFELLRCLDNFILSRTNLTELNSRAGRVCCEMDGASVPCQLSCRSALFAPTLSHVQKQKRVDTVCNRGHGSEIRGDSGVLNCLATTHQWLPQKHKMKL